jgi:hypothetical protein
MRIPNPPKPIENFAVAIIELLWLIVRVIAVTLLIAVKTFAGITNKARRYITGYSQESYLKNYEPIKDDTPAR